MSKQGPIVGKLKTTFKVTDVFFLLPCIAIYKGIHFMWLCFEFQIAQVYE